MDIFSLLKKFKISKSEEDDIILSTNDLQSSTFINNINSNIDQNSYNINNKYGELKDSLSELTDIVRNLSNKITHISEKIVEISEKVDKHEKEIEYLKDSIDKMILLYDLITRNYNPFIEDDLESFKNTDTKNKEKIEKDTILEENIYNSKTDIKEVDSVDNKDMKNNIFKENNKKTTKISVNESNYKKYLPLEDIKNDPSFIAIVLGWLNYLVRKSSFEEVEKAIEYYERIGWISNTVKVKLLKYLEGFKGISNNSNYKKLSPEDHLVSLYIISKLSEGMRTKIFKFSDLYDDLLTKGIIRPIREDL